MDPHPAEICAEAGLEEGPLTLSKGEPAPLQCANPVIQFTGKRNLSSLGRLRPNHTIIAAGRPGRDHIIGHPHDRVGNPVCLLLEDVVGGTDYQFWPGIRVAEDLPDFRPVCAWKAAERFRRESSQSSGAVTAFEFIGEYFHIHLLKNFNPSGSEILLWRKREV
jgi:hypothetical protein